jgi:hypothetical protein
LVARDVAAGVLAREYGAIGIGSGVTDVYQPLEAEKRLTRSVLEALITAGVPINLLTKNKLVLRDFDLLARFPQALVSVTITTLDPDVAAIIEPGASTPEERLEVIRQARAAGFHAGVMAMPFCPGISDGTDSMGRLFDAARNAGAEFVFPGGVTLRPGRQKDLFLATVAENWPSLSPTYERIFAENRPSGMPLASWANDLDSRQSRLLAERAIPSMTPHGVYRDLLSRADGLFVLLCHMENLYARRGVDTGPLKRATGTYAGWLKAERTALRRKRTPVAPSDPFPLTRALDERLAELCAGDGFAALIGNNRLAALARAIVVEGKTFDYTELKAK